MIRTSLPLLVLIGFTLVAGADEKPNVARHPTSDATGNSVPEVTPGRTLFLKNCAHCHGADARGDEGPDLHKLDESDEWIANRIRKGKKGQMTAFAGKLSDAEVNEVIAYLRTLK